MPANNQYNNSDKPNISYPTNHDRKKNKILIYSVGSITIALIGMWFFNFQNTIAKMASSDNNDGLLGTMQSDFNTVMDELAQLETDVQATSTPKSDVDKVKEAFGNVIETLDKENKEQKDETATSTENEVKRQPTETVTTTKLNTTTISISE